MKIISSICDAIASKTAMLLVGLALLLPFAGTVSAAITVDKTVVKDQGTSSATVATAAFSTTSANELLLAFVSADAPSSGTNTTVTGIATSGLTWTLVERTDTQRGTAEIWSAFATTTLTNVTVTATLSRSTVSSMTVMTFEGADPTGAIGAKGTGNSAKGAPTASLTTTRVNSLVIGVGDDWDNAINRTPGAAQTVIHTYLSPTGDTYWVQQQNSITPALGTLVTINDTAPTTDRYNLSTVEILAPSVVAVPNVVNLTQAAATTAITGAGLKVGTVTTASSATVAAGSVISQSPTSGTDVASGSSVSLVVSSGPPPVTVPNVVSLTQAAATTAITGAGLTVGTVTTAPSSTVAAGSVISQNPVSGAQVAPGSAVALVISSGPPVTVPNVVNLTQAAATTAITGAGLTVGTVTTASSPTVASGSVISQSPVSGAQVSPGSAVNIVVSTGPAPFTVPNVVNLTQAAATTAITGAGLTLGTVTTASSTTVASGSVISQNPTSGTQVAPSTAVNIVVSTGPPQVAVPSVVNETQAQATSDLTTAGLTLGAVTTASSTTVPSGSVISQNPTASTQVAVGSSVALVVSSGPPVTVPSVVNETQAQASSDLVAAGLTVGAITTASSPTVSTGSVISQNPVATTQVQAGSAVALVISSGSGTTVPSVVGTTQTAAAIAFSNVGLTLGTITTASSSTVAFGSVISQSPTSGTVVTPGSAVNIVVSSGPSTLLYPDLQDIIPPSGISVTGSGSTLTFQYTHDTLNAGPGPLVIQPVYNTATGNYQGIQYLYTHTGSTWTISQQIRVAGAFIFASTHDHFHFPLVTYGLYNVAADGTPGTAVALSGKIEFCINDSFIYLPNIANAGAIGNLGSCTVPTSLRGLDIGAVDEYDQTDPGQNISIAGVPNGTYWLRALDDPDNFLTDGNKANNETDVELTITGNTVTVLKTVVPVLAAPPSIIVTAPSDGSSAVGTVQLTANTSQTTGVQYLLDGSPLGSPVTTFPFSLSWDTTTVANGSHWLSAQTTGPTGVIGSAPVVAVNVANSTTNPPTVQITAPLPNSTVSAVVTLAANAGSGLGIASVTFYVDNTQIGTPITAPPFNSSWDTLTATAGTHVLTAVAIDTSGNSTTSTPITVTVNNTNPPNLITQDIAVSVDGSGTMTTPSFSTSVDGDLLVAFVSFDGPGNSPQTATVSGGGLPWTLAERSNTEAGTSEIWTAPAGETSTYTVTATPGSGGTYHGSLTVIAFTNASGYGMVGKSGAATGAPDVMLPGVSAGNWVFAVGNDWDKAQARTPVVGQVLVHQRVDTTVGDTYWVQSTTAPSTANALVDIHDSAPTTDRYNYAAIEIVATRQ